MSIPQIDVTACSIACANTFRPFWAKLDKRGRWAIVQDVYGLARDLARSDADALDYRAAAVELRRRIGGIGNLASYTRTLLVGAERRRELDAMDAHGEGLAQRPGGEL